MFINMGMCGCFVQPMHAVLLMSIGMQQLDMGICAGLNAHGTHMDVKLRAATASHLRLMGRDAWNTYKHGTP